MKGLVFKFQAGNFFQNNPYMLDLMVDLVVDAATKASPTTGAAMTHLIDCYCGSGLFCIGSSSHFDVCVGIEVNEIAITEARENAASNGIRNCDFVAASAEAIFSSVERVPTGEGRIHELRSGDAGEGCQTVAVVRIPHIEYPAVRLVPPDEAHRVPGRLRKDGGWGW